MNENAIKDLVKSTYNSIAASYQEIYSEVDAIDRKTHWETFANMCIGKKVLDMGCGNGDGTLFLLEKGTIPTAIDVSHVMIDLARRRSEKIEWIEGDICSCPFPDNTFSGIVLSYTINHLTDKMLCRVKEEVDRLLESGGVILLVFHVGCGDEVIEDPADSSLKIYYHYFTKKVLEEVFSNYVEVDYFQRESLDPAELMNDKAFFTLKKTSDRKKAR